MLSEEEIEISDEHQGDLLLWIKTDEWFTIQTIHERYFIDRIILWKSTHDKSLTQVYYIKRVQECQSFTVCVRLKGQYFDFEN